MFAHIHVATWLDRLKNMEVAQRFTLLTLFTLFVLYSNCFALLVCLYTLLKKIRMQLDWADGAFEQNVRLTGRVDNP